MHINKTRIREYLKSFDFCRLFIEELGWDRHEANLQVTVDGQTFNLTACAQKRGMAVFVCRLLPERSVRRKIERQVAKSAHEHLIIFTDAQNITQTWQWVKREMGKPDACRENTIYPNQSGEILVQKLEALAFSLQEEEQLNLPEVTGRTRKAFDVEKVTKSFYERFKKEHGAFLKFIDGISAQGDKEWYASIMLNRLMFLYFIQKKGFLDNDPNYLRNRLKMVQQYNGQDKFLSFYRYFLLRLMHEGLSQLKEKRKADLDDLIGAIPYLNGGIFEQHPLEKDYSGIDIPDNAFEGIFDFFDDYNWHLDERPLRNDKEINPDVLGYIFEKYINQKQMGAYYTKEDITEYIGKNTIIPFLFDAAQKKCRIAFEPGSALWRLLQDDPDRYIYEAVRRGVIDEHGQIIPLPPEIEAGINDVSQRSIWNKPAAPEYALPTEIWREHVARRKRCLEIRQKLTNGEVTQVNDLITYNLDIRQFAQDVIENSEGTELLRAFYQAIEKVTILDPTCGSGAFLFAALNILEPLYEACLERMESFVGELDASEEKHHSGKYSDFRKVLAQVDKHPNRRYFIFKSIILKNLFGVDIMEEATEICKLRLFLKLVAQVEKVEDVEPLPDIDFNIRAGNTLVGFATYEDVERAVTGKLSFDNTMERIQQKAEDVERLFEMFRRQQTELGGNITYEDKQRLREHLRTLEAELNRYLANDYEIDTNNPRQKADYDKWLASHKPFHWFIEFYGIMKNGGFDAIIGNPPYVEYSKVAKEYTIKNYKTENCGNLYAFIIERNNSLIFSTGRSGMIIPHSSICTDRMDDVQVQFQRDISSVWISTYSIRPAKLFVGVDQRLAIYLLQHKKTHNESAAINASTYHHWHEELRPKLFALIQYENISKMEFPNSLPKIHCLMERHLWNKLIKFQKAEKYLAIKHQSHTIYFHNAPRYWIRAMDFVPYFWNEREGEQISTQVKPLYFTDRKDASVIVAVLNSSLFYWWFVVLSDCRHLNLREIINFPVGLTQMQGNLRSQLIELSVKLMVDLKLHSKRKTAYYKTTGQVAYDEFYSRYSKSIIDEIDRALAQHYGFTDEELDFIINYDIKYRMGLTGEDGEDENL